MLLRHARSSTRALRRSRASALPPSLPSMPPHLKSMVPSSVVMLDTTATTIQRSIHTTAVRNEKKAAGTSIVAVGGDVVPSSSKGVAHPVSGLRNRGPPHRRDYLTVTPPPHSAAAPRQRLHLGQLD